MKVELRVPTTSLTSFGGLLLVALSPASFAAVILINLGVNGVPPKAEVVAALKKVRSRLGEDAKLIVMIPTGGHARDAVNGGAIVDRFPNREVDAMFPDKGGSGLQAHWPWKEVRFHNIRVMENKRPALRHNDKPPTPDRIFVPS